MTEIYKLADSLYRQAKESADIGFQLLPGIDATVRSSDLAIMGDMDIRENFLALEPQLGESFYFEYMFFKNLRDKLDDSNYIDFSSTIREALMAALKVRSEAGILETFEPFYLLQYLLTRQNQEGDFVYQQYLNDSGLVVDNVGISETLIIRLSSEVDVEKFYRALLEIPGLADDFVRLSSHEMAGQSAVSYVPVVQEILEREGVPADAWVIDVGTGVGANLGNLAEAMPDTKFLGIEMSNLHLSTFRKNTEGLDNIHLVQANAIHSLPLRPDSIDAVICMGVVGHLQVSAIQAMLNHLIPVLKDGAIILVGPQKLGGFGDMIFGQGENSIRILEVIKDEDEPTEIIDLTGDEA